MPFINAEIKARSNRIDEIRSWLIEHNADFKGTDHQTDTYFNVNSGRLKLREGNIENNLIFYQRKNQEGPKLSDCHLMPINNPPSLKKILASAMGVLAVVMKKREIYFIDNVKFHLDVVPDLGSFVEIEASNLYKDASKDELLKQCSYYMKELEISESDLVDRSYSDLLLINIT